MDCVSENNWGIITNASYSTGLPLAYKKRRGYSNIYQPFYSMFSDVLSPQAQIDEYLETVKNDFDFIHFTSQNKSKKHTVSNRVAQFLLLNKYKGLDSYSENGQRLVKKALKNELLFEKHSDANEVVSFFKNNKGNELKEFKPKDFLRLKKLISTTLEHQSGFCAHVKKGNEILASGFFTTYKDRITYVKGSVNEEGRKLGAMHFLLHSTIDSAKNAYSIYDFGGSNNKKLAEFYYKMGGTDFHYFEIKIDQENKLQKLLKKFF